MRCDSFAYYAVVHLLSAERVPPTTATPPRDTSTHRAVFSHHGWVAISSMVAAAFVTAASLSYIVERAKKCMDFTFTVYFIHVLVCWATTRSFPVSGSWWLVLVLCFIITAALGEYLCLQREMQEISVADIMRRRQGAADRATAAATGHGGGARAASRRGRRPTDAFEVHIAAAGASVEDEGAGALPPRGIFRSSTAAVGGSNTGSSNSSSGAVGGGGSNGEYRRVSTADPDVGMFRMSGTGAPPPLSSGGGSYQSVLTRRGSGAAAALLPSAAAGGGGGIADSRYATPQKGPSVPRGVAAAPIAAGAPGAAFGAVEGGRRPADAAPPTAPGASAGVAAASEGRDATLAPVLVRASSLESVAASVSDDSYSAVSHMTPNAGGGSSGGAFGQSPYSPASDAGAGLGLRFYGAAATSTAANTVVVTRGTIAGAGAIARRGRRDGGGAQAMSLPIAVGRAGGSGQPMHGAAGSGGPPLALGGGSGGASSSSSGGGAAGGGGHGPSASTSAAGLLAAAPGGAGAAGGAPHLPVDSTPKGKPRTAPPSLAGLGLWGRAAVEGLFSRSGGAASAAAPPAGER